MLQFSLWMSARMHKTLHSLSKFVLQKDESYVVAVDSLAFLCVGVAACNVSTWWSKTYSVMRQLVLCVQQTTFKGQHSSLQSLQIRIAVYIIAYVQEHSYM